MSWWFRRRSAGGEVAREDATDHRLTGTGGEAFPSPGLKLLLASLEQRGGAEVLDLGPAVPESVEVLAHLPARLHIESLYQCLAEGRRDRGRAEVEELIQHPEGTRFDALLLWDLLDYLEPGVLEPLVPVLCRHSRPGSWLYALVSYLPTMPEEPLRFKILDRETLSYQLASPRTRPAPRLGARDLCRRLPGFRLHTSYLLRNGYQELLFLRE